MFVLTYSNQDDNVKRYEARRYYFPKGIIKNYRKHFYNQSIDSDIKQNEEIRKLTTGQGEDYTTGCLLVYEYIKNQYRLIAVDFNRQKESHADPKAIQQIEFVGKLKNIDGVNTDGTQSMFVLTI